MKRLSEAGMGGWGEAKASTQNQNGEIFGIYRDLSRLISMNREWRGHRKGECKSASLRTPAGGAHSTPHTSLRSAYGATNNRRPRRTPFPQDVGGGYFLEK